MELREVIQIIQPTVTTTLVHDAVIRALLVSHPDRATVRRVAESLLMQQQSSSSASAAKQYLQTNVLDGRAQQALDSLFREPTVLPPDGD